MSKVFVQSVIEDLIKSEEASILKGTRVASEVTKAARHYVYHSKTPDIQLNGFIKTKTIELTVLNCTDAHIETVWFFDEISDGHITGYRISSWRDCLEMQVTEETANLAYLMIVTKAAETLSAQLIINKIV